MATVSVDRVKQVWLLCPRSKKSRCGFCACSPSGVNVASVSAVRQILGTDSEQM